MFATTNKDITIGALARRLLPLVVAAALSPAVSAQGVNGTTLAGYKTIDICVVDPAVENPAGTTWRYSGEISVWNEGVLDTIGLSITDFIEYKTGNKWLKAFDVAVPVVGEIPAGTTQETATVFKYSVDGAALPGTIRNNALITILNHSAHLGKAFGPNPKATYTGDNPPPPCLIEGSCVNTQGYWSNKPDVVWPTPYTRDAYFYLLNDPLTNATTWQQVFDTPAGGNAYYILAHQFMAATLNKARGEIVPEGVEVTLSAANAWFESNLPAACDKGGSCGTQKTWAGVLDSYNNGLYPDGPPHCGDEILP